MKKLAFILICLPLFLVAQKDSLKQVSSFAIYGELAGKGFFSVNVDVPIKGNKHHICFALTALDYEVLNEKMQDTFDVHTWMSPSLMYYYLKGKNNHFLELGAGMSISPFPNRVYDSPIHSDSPFSFHAVIGYRYQKPKGFLFRAGFTPFYRPKVWVLPLIGISCGWSW